MILGLFKDQSKAGKNSAAVPVAVARAYKLAKEFFFGRLPLFVCLFN